MRASIAVDQAVNPHQNARSSGVVLQAINLAAIVVSLFNTHLQSVAHGLRTRDGAEGCVCAVQREGDRRCAALSRSVHRQKGARSTAGLCSTFRLIAIQQHTRQKKLLHLARKAIFRLLLRLVRLVRLPLFQATSLLVPRRSALPMTLTPTLCLGIPLQTRQILRHYRR